MANHITQWKPEVTVNGQTTRFDSYKEVLKNMRLLLQRSSDNSVRVSRSRRGEWGEWFEYWSMSGAYRQKEGGRIIRKPVIVRQGWM